MGGDESGGPVSWSIDNAAKTITVKVNLGLWPAGGDKADPRPGAKITMAQTNAIHDEIMRFWDGKHYKCYVLRVDLTVQIFDLRSKFPATSSTSHLTSNRWLVFVTTSGSRKSATR